MQPFCLFVLVVLAAAVAGAALTGEAAQAPPETWPWPGPTPPEIREAKMKKASVRRPAPREMEAIEAAAPEKAPAAPLEPRRVLVWGRLWTHPANAFTEEAVRILGRKTKAFEVVAGDDPRLLLPESLKTFDALFWNGLHDRQPFLPLNWKGLPEDELREAKRLDTAVKQSVLEFVMNEGKGIAGIEGSLCALQDWREYGEMMGAFYNGHYWGRHVLKLEEPGHPLTACFEGQSFKIHDMAYIPGAPYSRKRLRVLLSVDRTRTPDPTADPKQAWLKEHVKRQERYTGREIDYAVSWVRRHGRGRVFYCSLGVNTASYSNPLFLRYLLAGIQFATGDLAGEATPSEE